MRKQITLLALAISTLGHALVETNYKNGQHRIFLQPDLSMNFADLETEESSLKSNGAQFGMKLGYEFFEPENVYGEFSFSQLLGQSKIEIQNHQEEPRIFDVKTWRRNIEGCLGYTVQMEDFLLTPFSGIGYSFWSPYDGYLSKMCYVPFGIKAEYQFPNLRAYQAQIGIKCERLQYVHYWAHSQEENVSGNLIGANVFGYEISIPISFKGLIRGPWNSTIEPYLLQLFDNLVIFGGRVTLDRTF